MSWILFHHNRIHIDSNSSRNNRECINSWKLGNTLRNGNLVKKEINTLGKQEQSTHGLPHPQKCRLKETIKLSAEINKVETTKKIQRINETNRWFFEKINNIDKPLAKLTNKKREGILLWNI